MIVLNQINQRRHGVLRISQIHSMRYVSFNLFKPKGNFMRVFGIVVSVFVAVLTAAPGHACDWNWDTQSNFKFLAKHPLIISADVGETRPAGFADGVETRPILETDLHVVKQWKGEPVKKLTVRYEDRAWSDCGFSFKGTKRLIITPSIDPPSVQDFTFWISSDDRGTGACSDQCRRQYTFREYETWLNQRFPAE